MVYFTADTHFGHANIIKFCNRPFASIAEHDRALIDAWNSRVKPTDTIYHLGDFAFKSANNPLQYAQQLNGEIHLIVGNHDETWLDRTDAADVFASVSYANHIIDEKGHRIWMAHYPLAEGPRRTYCLYGHVHDNTTWPQFAYLANLDDAEFYLNAGVDINHFAPATLEELISNNRAWRAAHA